MFRLIEAAILSFLTLLSTCGQSPNQSLTAAEVVRVVDGDTIVISYDGVTEYKVRYIGVDTPETVHPTVGEQPFGKLASDRNRELVEGHTVILEKDVSETDKYGRLLRYVWLDDQMINEVLIREGLAQVSTYPPDVKYTSRFIAAQADAREAKVGIWSEEVTDALG